MNLLTALRMLFNIPNLTIFVENNEHTCQIFSTYTNQELKDAIERELDPVHKQSLIEYAQWRKLYEKYGLPV